MLSKLLGIFGLQLKSKDNTPTGVDAVVTDYEERQSLSERSKRVDATWKSANRISDEGHFNSVTIANITFDLGEYGEKNISLDLEDELPTFMDDLGMEVADLPMLVDNNHTIPMMRVPEGWVIDWVSVDQMDLYDADPTV